MKNKEWKSKKKGRKRAWPREKNGEEDERNFEEIGNAKKWEWNENEDQNFAN